MYQNCPVLARNDLFLNILLKKGFAPPVLYLRFPQNFANFFENYLSLLIKLFSDDC